MTTATKDQKLAIRRNCGFNEDVKCELVQWVKNDNAQTSLNSLTFDEANKILEALGVRPLTPSKEGGTGGAWGAFDKDNPKHRVILSLLYQAQWTTNYKGREVPDLNRFSKWLQSDKAPSRKPLKKQDPKEVEKTIYALTQIVKGIWK